jgi:hypothetical protein
MQGDRAALNAAFARHVARALGPLAAYHPAPLCPQGHSVWRWYAGGTPKIRAIGHLCVGCLHYWLTDVLPDRAAYRARFAEMEAHETDPTWHPEWRIPPGAPQDFCGSLDLTVSALLRMGLRWDIATQVWHPGLSPQSVVSVRREGVRRIDQRYADEMIEESWDVSVWATALVRAALRVLGEEGSVEWQAR